MVKMYYTIYFKNKLEKVVSIGATTDKELTLLLEINKTLDKAITDGESIFIKIKDFRFNTKDMFAYECQIMGAL